MIRTIGLFWTADDVFWGAGKQPGKLLGVPKDNVTASPVDFRDQVGIYVLYADFDLIYVGQTGIGDQRLLSRLKTHRKDSLLGRWNKFSWFGVRWVKQTGGLAGVTRAAHPELAEVLDHMEAILIYASEPPLNRQGGRWGDKLEWYVQRRDPRLGPTDSERISKILDRLNQLG